MHSGGARTGVDRDGSLLRHRSANSRNIVETEARVQLVPHRGSGFGLKVVGHAAERVRDDRLHKQTCVQYAHTHSTGTRARAAPQ
jgi:hypothetical protein